jgi:hypothetical protein
MNEEAKLMTANAREIRDKCLNAVRALKDVAEHGDTIRHYSELAGEMGWVLTELVECAETLGPAAEEIIIAFDEALPALVEVVP